MDRRRNKSPKTILLSSVPSFRNFLRDKTAVPGGHASFIIDKAKSDARFPETTTWQRVRRYLYRLGVGDDTLVAARVLWRAYHSAHIKGAKNREPTRRRFKRRA
jgi:hypothetical protein